MHLLRRLLAIPISETTFQRRGFAPGDASKQRRLENIGGRFVYGFNTALENREAVLLGIALDALPCEDRGFAYEGAGMALALLDTLAPTTNRLNTFLAKVASSHCYLVNVGAGWILGRLPLRPTTLRRRLNPLLGWLALDGYGFHEAYFHPARTVRCRIRPQNLTGYEAHVFDQGVGRALWFIGCADIERVASSVTSFPEERRADLWSGVGLACAYAGDVVDDEIRLLQKRSYPYQAELAQGTAFAAKARYAARNATDNLERVAQILCSISAEQAAAVTDHALLQLEDEGDLPAYAVWRRRIRNALGGAL